MCIWVCGLRFTPAAGLDPMASCCPRKSHVPTITKPLHSLASIPSQPQTAPPPRADGPASYTHWLTAPKGSCHALSHVHAFVLSFARNTLTHWGHPDASYRLLKISSKMRPPHDPGRIREPPPCCSYGINVTVVSSARACCDCWRSHLYPWAQK